MNTETSPEQHPPKRMKTGDTETEMVRGKETNRSESYCVKLGDETADSEVEDLGISGKDFAYWVKKDEPEDYYGFDSSQSVFL